MSAYDDDADLAAARALLDTGLRQWDRMTDEERAAKNERRSVLGSLDDTYALNRHERGAA